MLIIIAGPSGVGKGTVIQALLRKMPELSLSISYTTRLPRASEVNGQGYYFVSEAEFAQVDLLESAEVHGYRYGTPNRPHTGDIVFEVDVQGADAIKKKRPEALTIFLVPPSQKELVERLKKRKTENKAQIEKRMETAKQEMKRQFDHDYIIINDKLEDTVEKVMEVIKLEKSKRRI